MSILSFMLLEYHFIMMSILFWLMSLSSHPIILGVLIISQALFLSLYIFNLFCISWFSILIFIVYLGGILMIFSYFISISKNNQKFIEKNNILWALTFFLINFFNYVLYFKKKNVIFFNMNLKEMLFSMFSDNMYLLSIFLMLLLLFAMICVVFITEKSKGNMKSL